MGNQQGLKTAKTVNERREELLEAYPVWNRDTIAAHFQKSVEAYADQAFMHINGMTYTYQNVWDHAVEIAKALIHNGVKRRDHLAVLLDNDAAYPSLMIASSMVGSVFIPLNSMLSKAELTYILRQSDTNHLVVHETVKDKQHAQTVAALWQTKEFQDASLEKVICMETDGDTEILDSFIKWEDFLHAGQEVSDTEWKQRWNASLYPDEAAIIMYTSGSTGSPKGVMLTHDMLLRCAFSTCYSRAIEKGRITFAPLPFYHCFAIVEAILAMSFVGGSFISALGASPLKSLELMEKYRANDYLCVPSTLVNLLNHPKVSEFDLSSLFAMWCGAAPAPVPVWKKAMDTLGLTEMITGYGQTEVSSSGVTTELGDSLEMISTRVGRPKLAGSSGLSEFQGHATEYKTINPQNGKDLEAGAVGELTVRGPSVTSGYYNKPEETAAVIDKDGWLRTGDVGRIDENGYVQLLGRSKEMYKVSGELVAPREVEAVISEHPAVAQAGVIGVPDSMTTEIGAAFIEVYDGEAVTRKEIVQWCTDKLARFKIPRYVWVISAFDWPLTSTGKIQKFRLQEMAEEKLNRP
ncbi:AMP-binding protein [Oceanobacillus oncorhynchi subsp. incaldanensis]|uniref:class I adenylate-forming enzyme family protein n=1 Tax=Oceanobacillus oncorhynchi TaxID=545501 RepID=UPI001868E797|nr:class I adenylate-forming enzyme family protein [Oceanobacillus oncorhynchi]GIO19946.1 AMP-binding protein [Oceanobacillus oncorhynchi subsp. incaldanensis]